MPNIRVSAEDFSPLACPSIQMIAFIYNHEYSPTSGLSWGRRRSSDHQKLIFGGPMTFILPLQPPFSLTNSVKQVKKQFQKNSVTVKEIRRKLTFFVKFTKSSKQNGDCVNSRVFLLGQKTKSFPEGTSGFSAIFQNPGGRFSIFLKTRILKGVITKICNFVFLRKVQKRSNLNGGAPGQSDA